MLDSTPNVDLQDIPEADFAALMGEQPPASTVTATNLPGSTAPSPEEELEEKEKGKEKQEQKKELTPEEEKQEIKDALEDEPEKDKSEDDDTSENTGVADILKAQAEGLIKRGLWFDFEGREEFEWTEENYGKLVELQAEAKAEQKYKEKIDETGEYGKVIFDYVKNGGNPDDIIDILKQSKQIENFDISSDNGKEQLIREYYTKVIGWSDSRATKWIKSLVNSGSEALKEEATEVKQFMEKHIEDKLEEKQQAQKEYQRQQKEAEKAWSDNITNAIRSREDLGDKEKRELSKALLEYNQKLPDGRTVNQFTIDFMKLQADPNKYLELVMFVRNPDKFKETVSKKASDEVSKKTWNFIKGNAALNTKGTGTSHNKTKGDVKKDLVIPKDFFNNI